VLTDIRPIVEKLMRQMVLAGLPVAAVACGDGRAPIGRAGDAGTGGVNTGGAAVHASGGAGGVGTGGGNGATGGGGGGMGGANACEPLTLACGTRSICPPFPMGPDGGGSPLPLDTKTVPFDPNDPRWADQYRACLDEGMAAACGADCKGFCTTVVTASGGSLFGSQYVGCAISCDAAATVTVQYQPGICGRRCVRSRRRWGGAISSDVLGQYLAEAAQLEAESVPAFARLARGLAAHGAPEQLVRAARAATTEEARHWKWTRALARRHGARPVKPAVERSDYPSLQALAEDNVIEGCVRETYGAMVAAHQAETAADPGVRRLMADIATDELGHAALSWRIDAWVGERLGAAFRERRAQISHAAAAELIAAARAPVADRLQIDAGLPSPDRSRALLATACAVIWAPNMAAGWSQAEVRC
jgi:hypothetical protein